MTKLTLIALASLSSILAAFDGRDFAREWYRQSHWNKRGHIGCADGHPIVENINFNAGLGIETINWEAIDCSKVEQTEFP